jgi:heme exporter protein A
VTVRVSLHLEGVGVARGGRLILAGLNQVFPAGAHVALVGPNGSGKTSLLRTIAGFLKPAEGKVRLVGAGDGADEDVGAYAHLLGHRDGLKGPLTAAAHLAYWRALLGGPGGLSTLDALAQVGLAVSADAPTRMFSAGMGRRLALARLLTAPRPLWLLDEPAAALDAAGKRLLDALITAHCAGGGIVVAAVHEPLGAPASHTITLSQGAAP